MCGIVGGTGQHWDYEAAVAALGHRGPDSRRIVSLPGLTLGFARLAIIDRNPEADQPMRATDAEVWVVFNGEIYGFASLRGRLEGLGHRFRTRSDTEVFLNAYLQWGDSCIDYLDGMFALAIYDGRSRHLKLCRDRPGIKPLYYYFDGKEFAFASELKGLTTLLRGVALQYDTTAVYDFLTYRYIPAPKSLYHKVWKLAPATMLAFDLEPRCIRTLRPYWRLEVPEAPQPVLVNRAAEELRSLLEESVYEQLVADVPVGFFLSGGIDSSSVVAASSRQRNHLRTFSIGFDSTGHNETPFAQEVAQHFGTDHTERTLSLEHAERLLHQLAHWYDEPYYDSSAIPTYLVSELARQSVTVVLTGDGGDEVFGGYRWYDILAEQTAPASELQLGLVRHLARAKNGLSANGFVFRILDRLEQQWSRGFDLHTKILGGMTRHEKRGYASLLGIAPDYDDYWYFRQFWRPALPVRTRLQYLDFHTYLPDDILTKVDRVSMAVSLEARVPLLSRRLIEFGFRLPEEVRYHEGHLKGLLKYALRELLPDHILRRPKQGFSMPRRYRRRGRLRSHERALREFFGFDTMDAAMSSAPPRLHRTASK